MQARSGRARRISARARRIIMRAPDCVAIGLPRRVIAGLAPRQEIIAAHHPSIVAVLRLLTGHTGPRTQRLDRSQLRARLAADRAFPADAHRDSQVDAPQARRASQEGDIQGSPAAGMWAEAAGSMAGGAAVDTRVAVADMQAEAADGGSGRNRYTPRTAALTGREPTGITVSKAADL